MNARSPRERELDFDMTLSEAPSHAVVRCGLLGWAADVLWEEIEACGVFSSSSLSMDRALDRGSRSRY